MDRFVVPVVPEDVDLQDLEVLSSPRGRGTRGKATDASGVYVDEREEVGRFLRAARPIRRGEAVLVEDALFLSPADGHELQVLLAQTCDLHAVEAAAVAVGCSASASSHGGPASTWLGIAEQLSLVVIQALIEAGDTEPPQCEAFRELRGDTERWAGPAGALWGLLNEDFRARITIEAVTEVYSIVAANLHATESGRAGVFPLGGLLEHSCAPTAFKEVAVPYGSFSRPGSPSCHEGSPPGSPCSRVSSMPTATPLNPQLVVRALSDLAEDDIVSISYISECLPTWKRREELQAGYGIVCTCRRCEREPEAVCAFYCIACGAGLCTPTAPVTSPGELRGHSFSCESCGDVTSEEATIAYYMQAELVEVVTQEYMSILHPYHWKVFGMYLHGLQELTPPDRVQVIERLMAAQQRLCKSDSHPLLGQLCELSATAHMDAGELPQAVAGFRRAQELYALSHRGPPDAGHEQRCYGQQMKVTAGRLGAVPRRLSKMSGTIGRSPSLPSLAEGELEDIAD
mmetsp:Transcript_11689/g.31475  ORF Transcript_11689/g.31475 Transcript_11689/m.31475 type:complete len:515 (+) Transcript_11689:79-1623(+)